MTVELLYTDGCPHAADYLLRLRQLLAVSGIDEPVRTRVLSSDEQAQQERFLGSPTIRIHGRDVDPTSDQRQDYGLTCRLYLGADGAPCGNPPDEWVLTTLRRSHPTEPTR